MSGIKNLATAAAQMAGNADVIKENFENSDKPLDAYPEKKKK